jgi:dTDP-4-amino-4,6-dideoxygalactose transaminase
LSNVKISSQAVMVQSTVRAARAQLAVEGGEAVRTVPFPERRLFGEEEKAAAVALFDEAIRTGRESAFGYGGAEEEAYCREFADYLGGGYADAVNSGSTAVYVALRALSLEPFTEVVVPALTDPGGIMPVPLLNCIPVVADCRPGSYNVGPEEVEAVLSERTSAIVVAHIAGEPVEVEPILELARARGIPVVEDCAQAHGAIYKGKPVGTWGDIAAFSTMSGKHHATGAQGGVVFTTREALYWAGRRAADRGKPFGLSGAQVAASSAASVVANTEASLNLNSSDLACAIGQVLLRKLPGIVAGRRRVAAAIARGLETRSHAVREGWVPEGGEPSYWFMRLSVDASRLTVGASEFARALGKEGIPVAARYDGAMQGTAAWLNERRVFGKSGYPWTAPEYAARGGDPARRFACPNAQAVLESDFNLRIHERWGDDEIEDTLKAIEKLEGAYAR